VCGRSVAFPVIVLSQKVTGAPSDGADDDGLSSFFFSSVVVFRVDLVAIAVGSTYHSNVLRIIVYCSRFTPAWGVVFEDCGLLFRA
jgi:hypothetical protein